MAKQLGNELLDKISGGGYTADDIYRLDDLTRKYKSQGLSKEETVKQLYIACNMAFEIPGAHCDWTFDDVDFIEEHFDVLGN